MDELRVTIQEIAREVGISIGSVPYILMEDLCMRRVSAKFARSFRSHNPNFPDEKQHTVSSTGTVSFLALFLTWKTRHLSRDRKLSEKRRRSSIAFQSRRSVDVSSYGRTAGRSVRTPKRVYFEGNWIKLMKCKNSNVLCLLNAIRITYYYKRYFSPYTCLRWYPWVYLS